MDRPRFSILIPLGFHRGQALRCVEAWTGDQASPRDRYQLVLAAPARTPEKDLAALEALLSPQDRVERFPLEHDIALAGAAARLADGEVLVFTEAHVLPAPGTLGRVEEILGDHPGWSGFSFRSEPITHNLLSEIEAGMYGAHIEANLSGHPWLKVLDQCLALTREAWEASGGLEPEYGHFAEWLFAARLRRAGLQVGFDPRAVVHHYYSGALDDLEVFTLDFVRGEIRFQDGPAADPCRGMFQPVRELTDLRQWNRPDAFHLLGLRVRSLRRVLAAGPSSGGPWLVDLARWGWRGAGGLAGAALLSGVRAALSRLRLQRSLRSGDRGRSRDRFVRWISTLEMRGRISYLLHRPGPFPPGPVRPGEAWEGGAWEAGGEGACAIGFLGFFAPEGAGEEAIRWSSDCAALVLPLSAGRQRVAVEWTQLRPLAPAERGSLTFFLDGRPVARESVVVEALRAELTVDQGASACRRLSWSVRPAPRPGDRRLLGLPVHRVTWGAPPVSGEAGRPGAAGSIPRGGR